MADPTKYKPHFNYSGWEAAGNKRPKPGAELDIDFQNIARSVDETIDALEDIRRSDGKLKNGIVDKDALDESSRELWESAEVAAEDAKGSAQSAAGAAASASTSAELARGYANDAVSQGNVPIYSTAQSVEGLEIPAGITAFRTNGYAIPGDGEGLLYVEGIERPGAVQSADGRWWVPDIPLGFTFTSVAVMQASIFLPIGAKIRTLGYHEPDDGGGNTYEVVSGGTGTADGGSFIDLLGGLLQAKGLFPTGVHAEQFGATGDVDSHQFINNALRFSRTVRYSTRLKADSTIDLGHSTLIQTTKEALLDFTGITGADTMISSVGTLGTSISAEAAKGSKIVSAPGHDFTAGDWIRLQSSIMADSAAAGEDMLGMRGNDVPFVETVCVVEVNDANSITVDRYLDYPYPTGSAVARVEYSDAPGLDGCIILCGTQAGVRPIRMTFARNARIKDVEIRGCTGPSLFLGCFDGSRIENIKITGNAASKAADNLQHIRILDGCDGFTINGFDLAVGGQMIDVSYLPSSAYRAPCRNTTIINGTVRDANYSAITAHPTQDGFVVKNVLGLGVFGVAYSRSRRTYFDNLVGYASQGEGNAIGVWFGEDGTWSDSTVRNCRMHRFAIGYGMSGHNSVLSWRVMLFENNQSYDCGIGELWGVIENNFFPDIKSLNSYHRNAGTRAISITRNWRKSVFEGFLIDGGCSEAAIFIDDDAYDSVFVGRVKNVTTKALQITGLPEGCLIDIQRDDSSVGIEAANKSRIYSPMRRIGLITSGFVSPGTTTTTIASNIGVVRNAFSDTTIIRVEVHGVITGTGGTKTLQLRAANSLISPTLNLPPSAWGRFSAQFTIIGTGTQTQRSFITAVVGGEAFNVATDRSVNTSTTFRLDLDGRVDDANDTISVEMMCVEASF